jgi:hypothetical protein
VAAWIVTRTSRAIVALTFVGDDRAEQQPAENAGRDARAIVAAVMMTVTTTITATAMVLATATVELLTATLPLTPALPLASSWRRTALALHNPDALPWLPTRDLVDVVGTPLHLDHRRTIAKLRGHGEVPDRACWRSMGGSGEQTGAKQYGNGQSHVQESL